MYASLRTYRIGSGSVDAVMRRVDRDFAEALSQEPGFVAYHAIDTGNDMVMTHRPTPETLALRKSRVAGGAFDGFWADFG